LTPNDDFVVVAALMLREIFGNDKVRQRDRACHAAAVGVLDRLERDKDGTLDASQPEANTTFPRMTAAYPAHSKTPEDANIKSTSRNCFNATASSPAECLDNLQLKE
jgi:hypothetical protein